MKYYLQVVNGTRVAGIAYNDVLPAGAVACSQAQYEAPDSWTVSEGAIVAQSVTLTLAQQAAAALKAGLAVSSTSTPALDGTYAVDATAQQHISAEITAVMLNGTFADGTDALAWLDAAGAAHSFTVAQFKVLASAVSAYVAALTKCQLGQLTALPAAAVVIA